MGQAMNQLAPVVASHAPALVASAGARASYRFLEFFTAQIRNPHTRRAYARAVTEFFDWLEAKGRPTVKTLADLEQLVVNHASQVSNCICILLAWDAPRQRLVEKLIMSGVPVLVLVVLASRPKVPLDAGPLRNDPANFHTLVLGAIETGLQLI